MIRPNGETATTCGLHGARPREQAHLYCRRARLIGTDQLGPLLLLVPLASSSRVGQASRVIRQPRRPACWRCALGDLRPEAEWDQRRGGFDSASELPRNAAISAPRPITSE